MKCAELNGHPLVVARLEDTPAAPVRMNWKGNTVPSDSLFPPASPPRRLSSREPAPGAGGAGRLSVLAAPRRCGFFVEGSNVLSITVRSGVFSSFKFERSSFLYLLRM